MRRRIGRHGFGLLIAITVSLGLVTWLTELKYSRTFHLLILNFTPKTWKSLPKDYSFFGPTTETIAAVAHSWTLGNRTCDWRLFDVQSSGLVPCDEIDGIGFPLCAAHDARRHVSSPGLPQPSFGASDTLGLASDECLDRQGRLGAYGSQDIRVGETVNSSFKMPTPPWSGVRLGGIQSTCVARNIDRFADAKHNGFEAKPRTAVLLRAWHDRSFLEDDVLNIRAMVTELCLASGGQFEVFILLHVRDDSMAERYAGRTPELLEAIDFPFELRDMAHVWGYADVQDAYPKVGEYDVFMHTFMPVQLFAMQHGEFEFFWNWELDVRLIGHYGSFLTRVAEWAKAQSEESLAIQNPRFYIPDFHKSYEAFMGASESSSHARDVSSTSGNGKDRVGDEADLITFFPLFDVNGTFWEFKDYLINYPSPEKKLMPRRASIITNIRLSRRLLSKMHTESQDLGHDMAPEMWPPTIALQNDFKAVYTPHSVYMERKWPADMLQKVFNAGPDGEVGRSIRGAISDEHNFHGSTWYYTTSFAIDLYRRWLGVAKDGPGSKQWEQSNGRMCLPTMLLHPVKSSHLMQR